MDEAKAQARGLLPGSTPALDSTSGFSPALKPGESASYRATSFLWTCLSTAGTRVCHEHLVILEMGQDP